MTDQHDCLRHTPHAKSIIIFDIDGCILDSSHRLDHLLKGDRPTYDRLHPQDETIHAGLVVYRHLIHTGVFLPLFITSRSECSRDYTTKQLRVVLGVSDDFKLNLLMRPNAEPDTPDAELKLRLLTEAGYKVEEVLVAFDDSPSVVEMWRSQGVDCYHTRPHLQAKPV